MVVVGEDSLTVELVDQLDPLRDEWVRLAAANRNVFATWEWNRLWWESYGNGKKLRIAVVCSDGVTRAIVPLYEWSRRPLRILLSDPIPQANADWAGL